MSVTPKPNSAVRMYWRRATMIFYTAICERQRSDITYLHTLFTICYKTTDALLPPSVRYLVQTYSRSICDLTLRDLLLESPVNKHSSNSYKDQHRVIYKTTRLPKCATHAGALFEKKSFYAFCGKIFFS